MTSMNMAIRARSLPSRMERDFAEAAESLGYAVSAPGQADIRNALRAIRERLTDTTETDHELIDFRDAIAVAANEIRQQPGAFQSVELTLVGSGLVLALAWTGKVKYRNGRWELVQGLPGFEKIARLVPGIFRRQAGTDGEA